MERLSDAGDLRVHLIDIWRWIDDQIKEMRKERKGIMKGTYSVGRRATRRRASRQKTSPPQ